MFEFFQKILFNKNFLGHFYADEVVKQRFPTQAGLLVYFDFISVLIDL